jgi:hypothetical protein
LRWLAEDYNLARLYRLKAAKTGIHMRQKIYELIGLYSQKNNSYPASDKSLLIGNAMINRKENLKAGQFSKR